MNLTIPTLFLLIFIVIFIIYIKRWIRRKQIKLAFKFGWMEHTSSRICFLFMSLALLTLYFKQYYACLILLFIAWLLWIFYFISHNLEKMAFKGGLGK